MKSAVYILMLLLFTIQSVGAMTDMHLLHAHAGQHQQLHNHQPGVAEPAASEQSKSRHPVTDSCHHSCNSHGNFTAQLPLPVPADLTAIHHQKIAHLPRPLDSTHSSSPFRPPIV